MKNGSEMAKSFSGLSQRISSAFLDVHIMFLPFCCVYSLHLSQFFWSMETENDTRARIDMEFLFSYLTRYLTGVHNKWVRYWVEHEERNFITTSNNQYYFVYYVHNRPLLKRKGKPTLLRHEKNKDSQSAKKSRKVRRQQGSRWKNALNHYKKKMGVTYNSQNS